MLAQPAEQSSKVAARDLRVEVGYVRADLLHQLGADQIADRVAGEDAEAHVRPVDVLQRAHLVVGHLEAEVGLDASAPRLGQIPHPELALEHLVLQLEAEQHVHVVGDLVRLDTDQRRV